MDIGGYTLESYGILRERNKEANVDLGVKDKCALVASSSRGLGFATARLLAMEGCRVVINGRDQAKVKQSAEVIAKESGSRVKGIAGDMSDPNVPERLVMEAASIMGGLALR